MKTNEASGAWGENHRNSVTATPHSISPGIASVAKNLIWYGDVGLGNGEKAGYHPSIRQSATMIKQFKPADYNLVANPLLRKTNSPFRLYAALFLMAAVVLVVWQIFPHPVHISQPTLEFSGGKVIAVSRVTNNTAKPMTLSLHFTIGSRVSNKVRSAVFLPGDYRDVSVTVAAHSTSSVPCDFPIPENVNSIYSMVELRKRQ
jgi:hypothetical protein